MVTTWIDQCISPGANIDTSISAALESADIVLLLLSQDFIASNYCYTRELGAALRLHEEGRCKVVPVLIRPCDWMSLPIGRLLALPSDALPVTTWDNQDLAWLDVARGIRVLVEQLGATPSTASRKPCAVRQFLGEEFNRLKEKYEARVDVSVDSRLSGYTLLDHAVDGYHAGDVVVIAGRPEAGGDSLLISSVVQNAIQRKLGVLVATPRVTGGDFSRQLICNLGRVPHQHMVEACLSEEDWPSITSAITLLADASILLDDTPSFSRRGLLSRIEAAAGSKSLALVAIAALDYFSYSGADDVSISDFGRSLKHLARKHGLVIVCSLNVGQGAGKAMAIPTLRDLDIWRCIEHDVDIIALMYVGSLYGEHVYEGDGQINLVKNPRGPRGDIAFTYFPETFQLVDVPSLQPT